jgi:hypothetical protein
MSLLATVFDDKRLMICCLFAWMCVLYGMFSHLGITEAQILSFGPSPHTRFMGVVIDTWWRWFVVAAFSFFKTLIDDLGSDSIVPWIQNTMQDQKTLYLPYSKFMCFAISSAWGLYCRLMSVFSIFVMLSQVDFVLVGALADLLVNTYTSYRFMRGKTEDPARYWQWLHEREAAVDPGADRAAAAHGIVLEMAEARHEADTSDLLVERRDGYA